MRIGAHESVAGGVHNAFGRAQEDGCEVLQVFTRSSRRWVSGEIAEDALAAWHESRRHGPIEPVAAHASYLINLASADTGVVQRSMTALFDEVERCQLLEIPYLVLHPGAHLERGEATGLRLVAAGLDEVLSHVDLGPRFRIALENTAGQGTNLGYRFEHLRDLLGLVARPERLAICLDTCHTFAAGYAIGEREGYESMVGAFDRIVGLEHLCLFHLNDSKGGFGSRVDRHAIIGEGELGLEPFRWLVNDERFGEHPGILETPSLPDGTRSYGYCVEVLRGMIGEG